MPRKVLSVGLSLLLTSGPLQALAEASLSERVRAREDAIKTTFQAGSLTRIDWEDLETEVQNAPSDQAAAAAWASFQPLALDYDQFRGDLLSLREDKLVSRVRKLGTLLGLDSTAVELLVPKYQQLQETLLRNGVTWGDGGYRKINGKAFTPDEWSVFLAERNPELDPAAAAKFDENNQELLAIQRLAKDKKYDEAVRRFDTLLYGLGQNKGLLEGGVGSLALETTLSLIHQTRASLPQAYQTQLEAGMGTLDRQMLDITSRKIYVPPVGAADQNGRPRATPLRTSAQLAFYGALSYLPLTSQWAREKFLQTGMSDMLRRDPSVQSFSFEPKDPAGQTRPGFSVTFRDGSKRFEGLDGVTFVTSADGRTVSRQDPRDGSYSKTVDGREVVSWTKDPATGAVRGRFHGMVFEAERGETLIFSPDGTKLFVAKGVNEQGEPRLDRWVGVGHERGRFLPNDMGQAVRYTREGRSHKDAVLNPALLKDLPDGGSIDLSAVPEEFLDPRHRPLFEAFLKDLPQFGLLFANGLKGHEDTETAQGRTSVNSIWVESFAIRDGQLHVVFGEKSAPPGTAAEPSYRHRIVAVVEDGSLKAFVFAGSTVFLWKFNPEWTVCDQFSPNAQAEVEEGRTAFELRRHYEKREGKWGLTRNIPYKTKEWTTWDSVKAMGSGALQGLGEGVGVVFSPFQTALYGLEGGIMLAGGAVTGSGFAKAYGVYTARQAKFNQWLGQGTKGEAQIMDAYYSAVGAAGDDGANFTSYLDSEVEKERRRRYGEMYRFHADDPIEDKDRAYTAARVWGLANLPGQQFEAGKEEFARGNVLGGVWQYGKGVFVIGGEAFVEGAGFGLAAQPLKVLAVGRATGLGADGVSKALRTSAQFLTANESRAVRLMRSINRTELALFLAPAGAAVASNMIGFYQSWKAGDTEGMWASADGVISNSSALVMGLGLSWGRSAVEAKVRDYTASRTPPPQEGTGPGNQQGTADQGGNTANNQANNTTNNQTNNTVAKQGETTVTAVGARGGVGVVEPVRPSGNVTVLSGGEQTTFNFTLDSKPSAMEATFVGQNAAGEGVVVKTAQYVGVAPKPRAQAAQALVLEATAMRETRALSEEPGWPQNVGVPKVLGLGWISAELAARIYGKRSQVPMLLMERAPGVTVQRWLAQGKTLNAQDFLGVFKAVKLMHKSGRIHGDLNDGNILITEDAQGRQSFTLIDFGPSKTRQQAGARFSDYAADDLQSLSTVLDSFRDEGLLVEGSAEETPR